MVFLLCAYVTVYMIYGKFRRTFDSENDTFRLEFLLVPVIGLSFLENYSFTPMEVRGVSGVNPHELAQPRAMLGLLSATAVTAMAITQTEQF